jgi:hypothetical protein
MGWVSHLFGNKSRNVSLAKTQQWAEFDDANAGISAGRVVSDPTFRYPQPLSDFLRRVQPLLKSEWFNVKTLHSPPPAELNVGQKAGLDCYFFEPIIAAEAAIHRFVVPKLWPAVHHCELFVGKIGNGRIRDYCLRGNDLLKKAIIA